MPARKWTDGLTYQPMMKFLRNAKKHIIVLSLLHLKMPKIPVYTWHGDRNTLMNTKIAEIAVALRVIFAAGDRPNRNHYNRDTLTTYDV